MNQEERRLGWVFRNRRERLRSEPIFTAARRVVDSLAHQPVGVEASLRLAVRDVVDAEFWDHCTLGPVKNGELTVKVRDARLLFSCRVQWSLDLLEGVQRACPACGVRRVRFVHDQNVRGAVGGG